MKTRSFILYRGHKDLDFRKSHGGFLCFSRHKKCAEAYASGSNDQNNLLMTDGMVTKVRFKGTCTRVSRNSWDLFKDPLLSKQMSNLLVSYDSVYTKNRVFITRKNANFIIL